MEGKKLSKNQKQLPGKKDRRYQPKTCTKLRKKLKNSFQKQHKKVQTEEMVACTHINSRLYVEKL